MQLRHTLYVSSGVLIIGVVTALVIFTMASAPVDLTAKRPLQELPASGESYVDDTYGQVVTRLSDSSARTAVNDRHLIKSDYSRVQAENADGTQLLVFASNADKKLGYALLETKGGTPKFLDLPKNNISTLDFLHSQTEARWHPNKSKVIRFIKGQNAQSGGLQVYEYDIAKEKVTLLSDLSGKLPRHWGKKLYGMTHFEGEYSRDGNRMAWSVETADNNSEESVGYVVFDVRNGGQVLGTMDYDGRNHDHLSISPSGKYVVISGTDKTSVFNANFSYERVLMRETQHSDLCITAKGHDCMVVVSFDDTENPHYGWVYVHDLETDKRTPLINVFERGNTSLHLSARSLSRPGWALMSTYNCQVGDSMEQETELCDRLFLLELKSKPRIIPVAWTHSSGSTYFAEPHATLSPSGQRIYFNSDWGSPDQIDVFRVDVPNHLYR